MIKKLETEAKADTYFPDQPILLTFERKGNRVFVSADVGEGMRRASVGEAELVSVIKAAGMIFFRKISELVPSKSASYQWALLQLLQ